MIRYIYLVMLVFFSSVVFTPSVDAVEKAERITDREIVEGLANIRGDIKELKAEIKRLDEGQNALKANISDIKTFMLWGFGILFGGMGIMIGFVLWDRRTALQPAE